MDWACVRWCMSTWSNRNNWLKQRVVQSNWKLLAKLHRSSGQNYAPSYLRQALCVTQSQSGRNLFNLEPRRFLLAETPSLSFWRYFQRLWAQQAVQARAFNSVCWTFAAEMQHQYSMAKKCRSRPKQHRATGPGNYVVISQHASCIYYEPFQQLRSRVALCRSVNWGASCCRHGSSQRKFLSVDNGIPRQCLRGQVERISSHLLHL